MVTENKIEGFVASVAINKIYLINSIFLFLTFGNGYNNDFIVAGISLFMFMVSVLYLFRAVKNNTTFYSKKMLLLVSIFFIFFSISELIALIQYGFNQKTLYYFYWGIFSIDSGFWGYYLAKNYLDKKLINSFKLSLLITAYISFLSLLFNWIKSYFVGYIIGNPNISNQKSGYYLFFSLCIFAFFLYFDNSYYKNTFIKIITNKIVLFIIITILPIIIFSYGSRGSFIATLILITFLFFGLFINSLRNKKFKIFRVYLLSILLMIVLIGNFYYNGSILVIGMNRIIPNSLIVKIKTAEINDNIDLESSKLNIDGSQNNKIQNNKIQNNKIQNNKIQNNKIQNNKIQNNKIQNNKIQNNKIQNTPETIQVSDVDAVTSGRGSLYIEAINTIKEKPILGYGAINYMYNFSKKFDYPHNLFLEWLLQGGFMYFSFMVILIIYCISSILKIVKYNNNIYLFILIGIYSLVNLMFSETYLTNSYFWFIFIFGLFIQKPIKS